MNARLIILTGLAAAIMLLAGCNTVAPKPSPALQGSFDEVPDLNGNHQNSGVLGFTTNQDLVITPDARARYLILIEVFGNRFVPPLSSTNEVVRVAPESICQQYHTKPLYLLSEFQLDHFATMTAWMRERIK